MRCSFSDSLKYGNSLERIYLDEWSSKLFVDLAEQVEIRVERDGGITKGDFLVAFFLDHRAGYNEGIDLICKLVFQVRQRHERLGIGIVWVVPFADGNCAFRQEKDVAGII